MVLHDSKSDFPLGDRYSIFYLWGFFFLSDYWKTTDGADGSLTCDLTVYLCCCFKNDSTFEGIALCDEFT